MIFKLKDIFLGKNLKEFLGKKDIRNLWGGWKHKLLILKEYMFTI